MLEIETSCWALILVMDFIIFIWFVMGWIDDIRFWLRIGKFKKAMAEAFGDEDV